MSYIYQDNGYMYLSIHRRIIEYDPRNTDNPIIQDILQTACVKNAETRRQTELQLIESDRHRYNSATLPIIPVSYQHLYHQLNIYWVTLIHQMVFVDNMYGTFYGGYGDVLEKIISASKPGSKDSLIYRYYHSGESVFHIAAKLWLIRTVNNSESDSISMKIARLENELEYIIECYSALGDVFNNGNGECIVDLTDYSSKSLYEYMNQFVEDLCNVF